ncbi:unnamed protein product [Caenorhabditis brenneri]
MSWLEHLNPFSWGTVTFWILIVFFILVFLRTGHTLMRTCRFSKIRKYNVQKKVKNFEQVNHAKFSFLCGPGDEQYCKQEDINFIHKFLTANFPNQIIEVPRNICSLWIPRDGFTCGTEFQDFKPHEGRAFESFLTYQMISNRMQVTWYNLRDGRRFVAGVCVYLRTKDEGTFLNPALEYKALQKSLDMWYDYTPQKRRSAKYACMQHGGLMKGVNMKKIVDRYQETSYQEMQPGDPIPNPPDYTALLMDEEQN